MQLIDSVYPRQVYVPFDIDLKYRSRKNGTMNLKGWKVDGKAVNRGTCDVIYIANLKASRHLSTALRITTSKRACTQDESWCAHTLWPVGP